MKNKKHCGGCDRDLPADLKHFGKNATKWDGLAHRCKKCIRREKNEWRAKNPDAREKEKAASRLYFKRLRQEALDKYGHVCQCCGEDHREFLCIDHIDGEGNKHRAKVVKIGMLRGGGGGRRVEE